MERSFAAAAAAFEKMDPRRIVGMALAEATKDTPHVAALYADVGRRFGLDIPEMQAGGVCLDTGIAEQDMVGVAAGMCAEGMAPVIISYAPFVTGRVFDQIKSNIGEMGFPIGLVGSASGLSKGDLGPLLMCVDDVAMLRTVPGMQIMEPADGMELYKSILAGVKSKKPFYVRMTGGHTLPAVYREDWPFQINKAVQMRAGRRVAMIAAGAVIVRVLEAADRLAAEGTPVAVLNMHTVKPLDTRALDAYADFETLITVEEHSTYGGLGSAVAEYLVQKGRGPALKCLGTPDSYFAADLYENLMEKAGLTADQLYRTAKSFL